MDVPSTLKPAEVAAAFVESSIAKHRTRADILFIKAFMAGMLLSVGGLLSQIAGGGIGTVLTTADPSIPKIFGAAVFPVGLIMIVLTQQELLTSNMMVMPMGVIKRAVPWWSIPMNWFIVFWGNLVGSLFFAAILVKYSAVISVAPYMAYVTSFATHKAVTPQWHQIFLRGIGCNWLVSIAVWQALAARETISKVFAVWIPIFVFVAAGYDHVVANMYSIPLGIMFNAPKPLTAGYYIWKSLIPSFIGNVIGAMFIALPANYYLLGDYSVSKALRSVEEGNDSDGSTTVPKQQ